MYAVVVTSRLATEYSFNVRGTLEEAKFLASELINYFVKELSLENDSIPIPQIILKEEYIRLWHSFDGLSYDTNGDYTDIRIYDMSRKTIMMDDTLLE